MIGGIVVDSAAVLAMFFGETHGPWANRQLKESPFACMSTINLAECLMLFRKRRPADAEEFERRLLELPIDFVPPDVQQAKIAAKARDRFPLNIGDCFAYALAKTENLPILTLDADFRHLDVPAILPPAA